MQPSAPPKSTSPEYEVHDFSRLQAHIDEGLSRVRQQRALKNSLIFGSYVKYGLLSVGALASAALVLAFAYWLAFSPPRPETKIVEVEKPIVVQTEKIVEVEKPIYLRSPDVSPGSEGSRADLRALQETIERLQKEASANRSGAEAKVIRNYTIFTTIESNIPGIKEITSGAVFNSSEDTFPRFQYCYLMQSIQNPASGIQKKLDVAKKIGKNNIMYHVISQRDLFEFGAVAESNIKKAQSLCHFY